MKLKYRFPLLFSLLFSLLLAVIMITVYYLFANFRRVEFKDRLSERAQTTGKLLLEVKEVDSQLLRIIDRNTINRLYNEQVQIYNDQKALIYNSNDDTTNHWTVAELSSLKRQKEVFTRHNAYDILGLYYGYGDQDYYVFISAEDKYGNSKLHYLKILLVGAYVLSISLVWSLSFYLSKKTLRTLDKVTQQIQHINTNNLTERLDEPKRKDEIKALVQSFNLMMNRIDKAYKSQKEFTSNASHELRTPVARIVMQLENLLKGHQAMQPAIKTSLKSIAEDAYQLSDIITSLLLLARMETQGKATAFQKVRLDEILFHTRAQLLQSHPDFKFHFEIENTTAQDITMEIDGDEQLLKIAFLNLLKNAYAYSDNKTVRCILRQQPSTLTLLVINTGEVPAVENTSSLFNTFTRGSNIKNKQGIGVGLSVVQRIVNYHQSNVAYNIPDKHTNEISITFQLPADRLN